MHSTKCMCAKEFNLIYRVIHSQRLMIDCWYVFFESFQSFLLSSFKLFCIAVAAVAAAAATTTENLSI